MAKGIEFSGFCDSRIPFLRWLDLAKYKKAVRMAQLRGNETVLDFGCGSKALQRVLPNGCKYIGYDISPQYSDVKDYAKLKGIDVVFALSVFEHLTPKELDVVLKNFKRMEVKKLVAEIVRDKSKVKRFASWLIGVDFDHALNHKIDWRTTVRIIGRYFKCNEYHNRFWISWLCVWSVR